MLYVFYVDIGRMINFDMNVAMSTVGNLKDTIERLHGIPAINVVLLASGGETLKATKQVSYYSAGTDTNPIYMFLKGDPRIPVPALTGVTQIETDFDLRDQVERCLELPATYETVVTRAHLAIRMFEIARDDERSCDRLVHEQHLQQQGWSSAVANFEDLAIEFKKRYEIFCIVFNYHLANRELYLQLLRNFPGDLKKLAEIPILPALMATSEHAFNGFDAVLAQQARFRRSNRLMPPKQITGVMVRTGETQTESSGSGCGCASGCASGSGSGSASGSSSSPNKKAKLGDESTDINTAATTTTAPITTIARIPTTTTIITNETIANTDTTLAIIETSNMLALASSSNDLSLTRSKGINLFQWITQKEDSKKLRTMSEETIQALATFTASVFDRLRHEVDHIIKLGEQTDIKEIKGLSDRLCKLEEFKYKIKKMVNDQRELSTAFQHNQNRANKLRDPTILPDLCASHQSQMQVMTQNHHKIRDISKIITRAKDELGSNVNTRLKRIIFIQNAMCDFDNRLLFYLHCMRRADRHTFIINQIHHAPEMYIAAVVEVVRRKIFSSEFARWATKLAADFEVIHTEEVQRRKAFNTSFKGHFLNILFPGMKELPPVFANKSTPFVFDAGLPNLTLMDLEELSEQMPDLASQYKLPDMRPVIKFFVSYSAEHQLQRMEQIVREKLLEEAAAAKAKEERRVVDADEDMDVKKCGCDVSTEFEKVNTTTTATMARSTTTDPLPLMLSATTLTDCNAMDLELEKGARAEVERLRGLLSNMTKLAMASVESVRTQVSAVRVEVTNSTESTKIQMQLLQNKFQLMNSHATEQQKEIEELREQLSNSKKERDQEVNELHEHNKELESQLLQLKAELQQAENSRSAAVTEAREQLIHNHKTELEALRCRFKLMTSMESAPSPTESGGSAEKSLPVDMLSLSEHETILNQIRSNIEMDKEKAVSVAVEGERALWQSKMFALNPESVMANVSVLREMLEERERQLEALRERDLMQTKENYQLKTRLDALTNEEGNSWMREKIEFLNRDKNRLEEELNMERSRRVEMETSVATIRSSSTNVGGTGAKLCGHSRCISLESCSKGDYVFVVWSMRHGQYIVAQDSSSLYFVHGDSLNALGLRLPPAVNLQTEMNTAAIAATGMAKQEPMPTIPLPFYGIGKVVDKEYCAARKDENRYRVSKGCRFYRIKLSPLSSKSSSSRRERMELSSVSRSISQSESTPQDSFYAGNIASVISTRSPRTAAAAAAAATSIAMATAAQSPTPPAIATSSSIIAKDTVDHAGALSPSASSITLTSASVYKERTISVTSVATDDGDEPLSLLSDGGGSTGGAVAGIGCRYLSVSEEDEHIAPTTTTEIHVQQHIQQQQQHQQSVITEQPTATITRDRLANSAVIPQIINTQLQQQQQQSEHTEQPIQTITQLETTTTEIETLTSSTLIENKIEIEKQDEVKDTDEKEKTADNDNDMNQQQTDGDTQILLETIDKPATAIIMLPVHQIGSDGTISIATTSEDSDEYRSLEPKEFEDETEFLTCAPPEGFLY